MFCQMAQVGELYRITKVWNELKNNVKVGDIVLCTRSFHKYKHHPRFVTPRGIFDMSLTEVEHVRA